MVRPTPTVIVAGASSGIGRAIARHLAERGPEVVGGSRRAAGRERRDVTDAAS